MIQLPDNELHGYAFIKYPAPNDSDLYDHVGAAHAAAAVDGADLAFSTYGVQHDAAYTAGALWNPDATFSLLYLFQAQGDSSPLTISFDSGDSIVIGYDATAKKAIVTVNGSDTDLVAGYWEVAGYGAVGVAVNQTSGHVSAFALTERHFQSETILDAPSGSIDGVTFGDAIESVWLAIGDDYWGRSEFIQAYRALRLKVLRRGLSMPTFTAAGSVVHPLGMADVRRTLTREIEAILKYHDSDFKVQERLRKQEFGATEKDRSDLMGSPVRFCDVLHMGSNDGGSDELELAQGSFAATQYRFLVTLWYEYQDDTEYSTSSQASWDTLIEDPDTGLLPQLRRLGSIDIAGADANGPGPNDLPPDVGTGDVALLGQPERAEVDHLRDSHWCRFELTVTTQF